MWRDTMLPARFFFVDARAAAFLLLFLFHMRTWTLALAGTAMAAFWLCERLGLTVPAALRALRCLVAGKRRPSTPSNRLRRSA